MEKQKKVGAIWKKKASNGSEFLSISIELDGKKLSFVAFPKTGRQETGFRDKRATASRGRGRENLRDRIPGPELRVLR